MTAKVVRGWFAKLGAKTLYIEPGSPWENGYCESFNDRLLLITLLFNTRRPQSCFCTVHKPGPFRQAAPENSPRAQLQSG